MELTLRQFKKEDLEEMTAIWNQVVEEANAFPQENIFSLREAEEFFAEQSYTGVAEADGKILGLYILHPNNVGRCGHLSNASYAVSKEARGRHIGEQLVLDCMERARELGYKVLQFNAVVASNQGALRLYDRLGFQRLGTVPGGYRMSDGGYEDIILFYITL